MDLNNSVTIRITVAAAVLKLFSVFFVVKLGDRPLGPLCLLQCSSPKSYFCFELCKMKEKAEQEGDPQVSS